LLANANPNSAWSFAVTGSQLWNGLLKSLRRLYTELAELK